MPRYFIGIPVPDSYHAKVEALAATLDARLSSKVRWIKPDNAHITLSYRSCGRRTTSDLKLFSEPYLFLLSLCAWVDVR